jgi:hypothetical protein
MSQRRASTGALAEHPPSPRLRRTRTLGYPAAAARFSAGNNGGEGSRRHTHHVLKQKDIFCNFVLKNRKNRVYYQ